MRTDALSDNAPDNYLDKPRDKRFDKIENTQDWIAFIQYNEVRDILIVAFIFLLFVARAGGLRCAPIGHGRAHLSPVGGTAGYSYLYFDPAPGAIMRPNGGSPRPVFSFHKFIAAAALLKYRK
jgi:hypothetical protein